MSTCSRNSSCWAVPTSSPNYHSPPSTTPHPILTKVTNTLSHYSPLSPTVKTHLSHKSKSIPPFIYLSYRNNFYLYKFTDPNNLNNVKKYTQNKIKYKFDNIFNGMQELVQKHLHLLTLSGRSIIIIYGHKSILIIT